MELVSCGFGITSLSGRSVVERKSNPMEPVSSGYGITLWGGSRVVEWKSNPMELVSCGFGITLLGGRSVVEKKQCRNGCKRTFYNKKDIIYNSHIRQSMNKKY